MVESDETGQVKHTIQIHSVNPNPHKFTQLTLTNCKQNKLQYRIRQIQRSSRSRIFIKVGLSQGAGIEPAYRRLWDRHTSHSAIHTCYAQWSRSRVVDDLLTSKCHQTTWNWINQPFYSSQWHNARVWPDFQGTVQTAEGSDFEKCRWISEAHTPPPPPPANGGQKFV